MTKCPHCSRSLVDFDHPQFTLTPDGHNLILYPYRLTLGVTLLTLYDGVCYYVDDPETGGCGFAWNKFTQDNPHGSTYTIVQSIVDELNRQLQESTGEIGKVLGCHGSGESRGDSTGGSSDENGSRTQSTELVRRGVHSA